MSASQVDPHDEMRSRDINKVAKGEQAPQPAHKPGTVLRPPPPKQVDKELSKAKGSEQDKRGNDEQGEMVDLETTPVDRRFSFINQTRHYYARYLEYHSESCLTCIQKKGENVPECWRFVRHYRSLCPSEWVNGLDTIERWNEQREHGTFPGQI